jgi:hypothetical protein
MKEGTVSVPHNAPALIVMMTYVQVVLYLGGAGAAEVKPLLCVQVFFKNISHENHSIQI